MGNIRTNKQYDLIRNNLKARSLYSPEHPYEIENPKLVKAINSIASLIPGKSIDITNTPYGRLLIGPKTPITIVGEEMYARNIAQSVTSFAIADALPSVNFRNLFDGNPNTHLLTKKEDYRITKDETKSTIGKLIQDITNQSPQLTNAVFTGKAQLAPFDKFPNQFDYIRNTGKGQLNQYYGSIGNNLYIQSSNDFIQVAKDQGYKIDKVTKSLLNKSFFPTNDPDNFPDGQLASDDVRSEIVLLREDTTEQSISEYGSNPQKNSLGNTVKPVLPKLAQNLPNQERDSDFEFDDNGFGFNENIDNQIVWGRDNTDTIKSKFGVRSGALLYTKGLLQARGSRAFFDQTKKKYVNRDGSLMYNGSPLTRDLNGTINRNRQHTIIDPYDRYSKAIRFTGNTIYNAPVESVINKTVIPKFHPVIDTNNNINNKNMMFSIENLAYILNDKGYLGDGQGTKVPQSEVGYNRGRLMWFAPYDVEINETATAKYESTQFIGRTEPIYSYQSSERSARLNFKLIVDYPSQIDNQSHGDIAKFFAFGGTFNDIKNIDLDKETAKLKDLENQVSTIQPTETLSPPNDLKSGIAGTFYFHNNGSSVTEDLSNNYEDGTQQIKEETEFGLNKTFVNDIIVLVSQTLNSENFTLYDLKFVGRSSRLFFDKNAENDFNQELGRKRANSLKNYVESEFKRLNNGLTFQKAGINIIIATSGSTGGSDAGALEKNISLKEVKLERNAIVNLVPNGTLQKKPIPLTTSQIEQKNTLNIEISSKKTLLAVAAKAQSDERIFNQIKISDRAFKGFESMKKLTFSPVYHSQTPEDFHRRLTFLHQCTRQGNSIVNRSTQDSGISVPRNSAFGRPPICVLRLGDMFHSKVIIESVDFDYSDSIWDINPESGMGMQYMIASIGLSLKIIGGQSLKGAIDVLQNAESFNYYANSTFNKNGVYQSARKVEDAQVAGDSTLINAKGEARFGKGNLGNEGTNI